MIEPYPLRWPANEPRTPATNRAKPKFASALGHARDSLLREIRLLPGIDVVITSDLPVRRDGMPYANGRSGGDPGIAVYWRQRGKTGYAERVMACDRWSSHGANMRAIAMSIGALRGLDRWGSSSLVERAFAGFAALPADAATDWRIELGIKEAFVTLGYVRDCYRQLAAKHHPDRGGDPDAMMRLNQAYEAAQKELAHATER